MKSRDIILASQDDDEANDPSLARAIHVYEIKYGKSETNRISAQCLLAAAQRANPGYPLNTVSSCRNSALAGLNPAKTSTQTDNETHRGAGNFKGKHNERTGGETSVKFRIASGESQSLAVRKYLASMYGKSLKPYQRAYIENRIVDLIGNVDDVHTGAVFTTSKEKIDRVIQRSSKLSVDARSAWSAYITY